MCRYGFRTYKSHFACFTCRKTFKQPHFADLLKRIGKWQYFEKLKRKPLTVLSEKERLQMEEFEGKYRDRSVKCPQCGGYMADLGLDFKSPKKAAENEWKIIQGLYTIGRSFYSCGCNGIGYIPQHPRDYQVYLNNVLQEYENSIAYYQSKPVTECQDKADRIKYWSEKAAAVKVELARQKVGS